MHATACPAPSATDPYQINGFAEEADVTVVRLTTDSSPNSQPIASDARLGRLVRLRLRPALDDVLGEIWGAGFGLIEAAEDTVERGAHDATLTDVLETAGNDLWRSLEAADRLYCELARICKALEPKTLGH